MGECQIEIICTGPGCANADLLHRCLYTARMCRCWNASLVQLVGSSDYLLYCSCVAWITNRFSLVHRNDVGFIEFLKNAAGGWLYGQELSKMNGRPSGWSGVGRWTYSRSGGVPAIFTLLGFAFSSSFQLSALPFSDRLFAFNHYWGVSVVVCLVLFILYQFCWTAYQIMASCVILKSGPDNDAVPEWCVNFCML